MTIGQLLAHFKRKPHVRNVLKDNYLKLTKAEYANLCDWEHVHVNMISVNKDYRLDDGVNIIEVFCKNNVFKLWIEVSNKSVVRSYLM